MRSLLIQSCSKSKADVDHPVPAIELYSGYYYQIIKKAIREKDFDPSIDICILSAKYGIVDPDTELRPYDQKMNPTRARELRDEVKRGLKRRISTRSYEHILVNMGKPYREAIQGLETEVTIPVTTIEGNLGERGRQLKQHIRRSVPVSVRAD